ncbi:hypothetical protein FHP25_25480 [Vineibacter terrae]|uniref:Transcriptional regulator-like domain-containing protein n=1 Tax=Vineibacter terrae TaxID=2586908 RepID=A0A5C8PGS9_9HYPH|nr:DUF6499 domain-containing protein [Vineibacter terrae]TXL72398.1 hypothetical protein FHP25_25480 [Vineibacter terrae]
MTPDASGWRSSVRYAHVADMTASDIAWEWLRRNESYDSDFQALAASKDEPHALTDEIGQRWGLRFPGGPDAGTTRSASDLASPERHKRHRSWRASRYSVRTR